MKRYSILRKWWDGRGPVNRLYDPQKRYQGKQIAGIIDLPDDWEPPRAFDIQYGADGEPMRDDKGQVVHIEVDQDKMALSGYVDGNGVFYPGQDEPPKTRQPKARQPKTKVAAE